MYETCWYEDCVGMLSWFSKY